MGVGAALGLWTCRGHREEPGPSCARQRPGFRFGGAEAAVISGAGRMLRNQPVPLSPPKCPSEGGKWGRD